MNDLLEYSVTCDRCRTKTSSGFGACDTNTQYIEIMRGQGWIIPAAIENKLILCPTCKGK